MSQAWQDDSRFQSAPPPVPGQAIGVCSVVYLMVLTGIAAAIWFWSEDWWLSMILVYSPKAPLAIPAGFLLLCALAFRPRWVFVNLLSLAVVFGPIMGFVAPLSRWSQGVVTESPDDLRIVSCNIQAFRPDFATVIEELAEHRPDIVAFQEVQGEDHPLLSKFFAGWNVARNDGYWVGSKYPVRLIQPIATKTFDRIAGVIAEVDLPTGTVLVADIHLMTARRSLGELTPKAILAGYGPDIIVPHQAEREEEVMEIRLQIDDLRGAKPVIVLGDFNTPSTSSLFRRWWGEYHNAFDEAGFGFGYTSPCRKNQRYWFDDTPWVRIDHVLCSPEWEVVSSDVGTRDGSDHRLIAASVRLMSVPTSQVTSREAQPPTD